MTYRTVFFGTPPFAVPALEALAEVTEIAAVVSQPDRPSGRGMKLRPSAVKQAAIRLGLPVHQPSKVRTGELQQWLENLNVDVALVVAYGRILPLGVLRAPRLGCVNLHASVLPQLRGAGPIQWAILNGETKTGISLMQMDVGMDTGPVFAIREIEIASGDTGGTLTESMAQLAAQMVGRELCEVLAGNSAARAQENNRATEAPPLRGPDFLIDWRRPALEISNQVRALAPAPGAVTFLNGSRLKILAGEAIACDEIEPGVLRVEGLAAKIGCGSGALQLHMAQAAGRKAQPVRDLLNGRLLQDGQVLGGGPGQS